MMVLSRQSIEYQVVSFEMAYLYLLLDTCHKTVRSNIGLWRENVKVILDYYYKNQKVLVLKLPIRISFLGCVESNYQKRFILQCE